MDIRVENLLLEDWGSISYTIIFQEIDHHTLQIESYEIECSIIMGNVQITSEYNKKISQKIYKIAKSFGHTIQNEIEKIIQDKLSKYEGATINSKISKKLLPEKTTNFIFSVSDEVNWVVNNNPLRMLQLAMSA